MTMKKIVQSNSMFVIKKSSTDKKLYPPGFSYRIGGVIYTVKEDVTKDPGSEMRRVVTSAGDTEIMAVEVITKDLKEADAAIISAGEKTDTMKKEASVQNELPKTPRKRGRPKKDGK